MGGGGGGGGGWQECTTVYIHLAPGPLYIHNFVKFDHVPNQRCCT